MGTGKGGALKTRSISLLLAVIALTAVAAGCGSGSGSESSGTQASTATTGKSSEAGAGSAEKEAFIKRAGTACTKARESGFERIAAGGKGQKSGAAEAEDTIIAVLLGTLRAEVGAIRSLLPPAEDEAEIGEIVTEMEAALNKAESMKGASPEEIEALFADSDKKLEAYGLAACSKSA